VTRFRPFRNSDPPTLVKLWNQAAPEHAAVRPLRVHEFDTHALGMVTFDHAGLILAEKDGRTVGFVHAGFGPDLPVEITRPFDLCHELGTIIMMVVEPGLDDPLVVDGLIKAAQAYLVERGAKVQYAGGVFPLNPFYWGLYGGSEGSGIVSGHPQFQGSLLKHGYKPVSTSWLLEADLAVPERRDPRAGLIRRQTQIEFTDDAMPRDWWHNLALGEFQLMSARLLNKSDHMPVAQAEAWDMGWFDRDDGRTRRKGYGRFLLTEFFRRARENLIASVAVTTSSVNLPALALYESLGFRQTDQSTLYRLSSQVDRPANHG
jgi:GNAT superfamily N-acetyltransferase